MTTPGEPPKGGEQPPSGSVIVSKRPRASREVIHLAEAIWDLFNTLVQRSSDGDDLQGLGDWWDEHKHKLERIMRTKGGA